MLARAFMNPLFEYVGLLLFVRLNGIVLTMIINSDIKVTAK